MGVLNSIEETTDIRTLGDFTNKLRDVTCQSSLSLTDTEIVTCNKR